MPRERIADLLLVVPKGDNRRAGVLDAAEVRLQVPRQSLASNCAATCTRCAATIRASKSSCISVPSPFGRGLGVRAEARVRLGADKRLSKIEFSESPRGKTSPPAPLPLRERGVLLGEQIDAIATDRRG